MKTELKQLLIGIEQHIIDHLNKMKAIENSGTYDDEFMYQSILTKKNQELNRLNLKLMAIVEGVRQIIEEEESK